MDPLAAISNRRRRKKISKQIGFIIPQRYILGIMGFLALVNLFLMRIVLSIAITEMVLPRTNVENGNITHISTCPQSPHIPSNVTHLAAVKSEYFYNWSETTQGLVLGAFYWGYLITQIPGGIMAQRFGGKYTLGISVLLTSVLTTLTPATVKAGDWPWLVVIRIFTGMAEGASLPALIDMLAKWTPLSERSSLGTIMFSGIHIGNVIGGILSGIIISTTETWESVFYVFGAAGTVWFVFWIILCYSEPRLHPFISNKEIEYLKKELPNVSSETAVIPWKAILTSAPVWALILMTIGEGWGTFTMATNLPKYMKSILKFDVAEIGLWFSAACLTTWLVSMLSGPLCDWLVIKRYASISIVRKLCAAIASVGSGVFILASSYAGCDRTNSVIFLILGMGFMGFFTTSIVINPVDLSPRFASTIMGVKKIPSSLTGILSPYLVGVIAKDQTISQWQIVFWICFGVLIVTNLVYTVCASGDVQWWDDVESNRDSKSKNGDDTCL